MVKAASPLLPIVPNTENIKKIRDVVLEKETADTGPSEGSSLTDLSGEFGDALKPATDMLARIRNVLDNINGSIAFLSGQLLDAMGADKEAREAAAAEAAVEGARTPDVPKEEEDKVVVNVADKARGILDLIFGAIGTLIAGKVIKDFLSKNFPELSNKIDTFFEDLVAGIRTFALPAFVGGIAKIFGGIGNKIRSLGQMLGIVEKTMDVGKTVGPITKAFQAIGKFLGTLGKLVPFASKLPGLNLIFGIIDIFKGFQMGEEKFGGILGGLVGSVEQLLKGFIGMPLDLLKKGISFIFEKLGFENVSEALDNFSFEDLIGNIVEGLVDFVKSIFGSIKKIINKAAKFIPGFDGFEMTEAEKQAQVQEEVMSPEAQEKIRERAIDELGGDFEKGGILKLNKSREELTPEQNEAVAQKMAEITKQESEKILGQPTKIIEEEIEKGATQKAIEQAEAIEKGPMTTTGSDLKERGQEPKTIALVNQQTSAPQNVDNRTVVNNTNNNTSVTRSTPNIDTHNNDSSLFGAVASTYSI